MNEQPRREESFWPFVVFFVVLGVVLWGMFQIIQPHPVPVTPTSTPQPVVAAPTETATPEAMAGMVMVSAGNAQAGDQIYHTLCFACHGFDARGIAGLGKPLIDSEFVNTTSDADLVAFIIRGRDVIDPANTTGVAMPPRGGSPVLTEQDITNVVAYIRNLNAGQAVAAVGTPLPPALTPVLGTPQPFVAPDINALDPAVAPPSHGVSGQLDLSLPDGQSAYLWLCSGCHGADGRGLADADLTQITLDDGALVSLLTQAGPAESPAFVHGVRGGYPPLADVQVDALIAYLRTL